MKSQHKKIYKILKVAAFLAIFGVLAIAIWNKIHLQTCQKVVESQRTNNARLKDISKKLENAVIKSQKASMKFIGEQLILNNIELLFPEKSSIIRDTTSPRIVLAFSEFSCNVCADTETAFMVKFAEKMGKDFASAIIYADSRRYVRNYVRMNKVNFSVYYSIDNSFFTENGIQNTPMLFVLDEYNRVIISHYPIPGHPEYSEPIHSFCTDYFQKYRSSH